MTQISNIENSDKIPKPFAIIADIKKEQNRCWHWFCLLAVPALFLLSGILVGFFSYRIGQQAEWEAREALVTTPPPSDLPIHCQLSSWGEWVTILPCSEESGGSAVQIRNKTIALTAKYGGNLCAEHERTQTKVNTCPIDCQFSSWGKWVTVLPCSEKTGESEVQIRNRTISRIAKFGGKLCAEDERMETKVKTCPVDCQFSSWGEWVTILHCSEKTGESEVQIRNRTITRIAKFGGKVCAEDERTESKVNTCPVDYQFSPWGEWVTIIARGFLCLLLDFFF